MDAHAFVRELEALRDERLQAMVEIARPSGGAAREGGDLVQLLQMALAAQLHTGEIACRWMPATPELDIKIAFARLAGDQARHFTLVEQRLARVGFDVRSFAPPPAGALFVYLGELRTSLERVAGGLLALQAIAGETNESFIRLCAGRGDDETVRIYRDVIQPDARAHERAGRELLATHASDEIIRGRARAAVLRTLELAEAERSLAAERLGTPRFPGG